MSEPQTDYASSLRAYEIVMLVTPIIAIILRFWGRTLGANSKGPTYWWDDWVCLMALVRRKTKSIVGIVWFGGDLLTPCVCETAIECNK